MECVCAISDFRHCSQREIVRVSPRMCTFYTFARTPRTDAMRLIIIKIIMFKSDHRARSLRACIQYLLQDRPRSHGGGGPFFPLWRARKSYGYKYAFSARCLLVVNVSLSTPRPPASSNRRKLCLGKRSQPYIMYTTYATHTYIRRYTFHYRQQSFIYFFLFFFFLSTFFCPNALYYHHRRIHNT